MINLITGTPGSGKTYLSIKLLTDKYFFWHKKDKKFYRKKEFADIEIFTNIDTLALPHKNLVTIFNDQKLTFESFFTPSYQDKLHNKYPKIIYIIDECQQYIGSRFSAKDTILYFDTHRHYGDTIYLITQDFKKISISINTLVELEYRAVKSTFTIFGEFRYNIKSNGEIFKRLSCRKDKRLFALYKSFQGDDQIKHGNPLKIILALLLFGFVFLGVYFYKKITPNDDEINATNEARHKPIRDLVDKNNTTNFKDEKVAALGDKKNNQSDIDLNRITAIEIESNVVKDNKLYAFECPITKKWYFYFENPYQIKKVEEKYYIFLSYKKVLQIRSDNAFMI